MKMKKVEGNEAYLIFLLSFRRRAESRRDSGSGDRFGVGGFGRRGRGGFLLVVLGIGNQIAKHRINVISASCFRFEWRSDLLLEKINK